MKLLVIEDDSGVRTALRHGLRDQFSIDAAGTAKVAQQLLEENRYDAIILDLHLPDRPGLEVCEDMRAHGDSTPILVLTGQGAVKDKITLLDAGADDYITKPFSLEEIGARLRALTRRDGSATSSRIELGDLILDVATREVWRQGVEIQLRRKEFELLQYLMRKAGKVVTRAMIIDHVWDGNDTLWTNSIDVHIKSLRDQVDRPFDERIIKTVHGVGYKLDVSKLVATQ